MNEDAESYAGMIEMGRVCLAESVVDAEDVHLFDQSIASLRETLVQMGVDMQNEHELKLVMIGMAVQGWYHHVITAEAITHAVEHGHYAILPELAAQSVAQSVAMVLTILDNLTPENKHCGSWVSHVEHDYPEKVPGRTLHCGGGFMFNNTPAAPTELKEKTRQCDSVMRHGAHVYHEGNLLADTGFSMWWCEGVG